MRSREEWMKRWRLHVAGLALFGRYSEEKDGLATRTAKILDIPSEVMKLLEKMYDDLTADETPINGTPRPGQNGATHSPTKR